MFLFLAVAEDIGSAGGSIALCWDVIGAVIRVGSVTLLPDDVIVQVGIASGLRLRISWQI